MHIYEGHRSTRGVLWRYFYSKPGNTAKCNAIVSEFLELNFNLIMNVNSKVLLPGLLLSVPP